MVYTLKNLKYIQSIDLVLSISVPYILNIQCAADLQQESQTEPAKTNFLSALCFWPRSSAISLVL